MSMEALRIDTWLYNTLSGDTTINTDVGGRIYEGFAEITATPPYIVYRLLSSVDSRTVNNKRIMANCVYEIVVIDKTESYSTIKALADRVDTVLDTAAGSVSDGTIFSCVRESTIKMETIENGYEFRHLGGKYRIFGQST